MVWLSGMRLLLVFRHLKWTLVWSVPIWNLRHRSASRYERQASCRKCYRDLLPVRGTNYFSKSPSRRRMRDLLAPTSDAKMMHVVSNTLGRVDWSAELARGDLEQAVQQLKRLPGKGQ